MALREREREREILFFIDEIGHSDILYSSQFLNSIMIISYIIMLATLINYNINKKKKSKTITTKNIERERERERVKVTHT